MNFRYLTVLFAMLLLAADGFAQQRYQVAACDWMMLKRQKLGEFQLTKQIGADGVEMETMRDVLGHTSTNTTRLYVAQMQSQLLIRNSPAKRLENVLRLSHHP